MSIIKGKSALSMLALTGALATAMAAPSAAGSPEIAYGGKVKFRERKPANRPAGSKLARKAARGKL